MPDKLNIAVFCASSNAVDEKYMSVADELGVLAAKNNWRIIYGGGHIGLMGRVADAALNEGGEVIGYIPEHMKTKEIAHESLTKLYVTENMHQRQKGMADHADGFIILPGGLGTLAEFFEILTWKQIRLHQKPIAIVNSDGYWDHLIKMMDQGIEESFIRQRDRALYDVFETVEPLTRYFSR